MSGNQFAVVAFLSVTASLILGGCGGATSDAEDQRTTQRTSSLADEALGLQPEGKGPTKDGTSKGTTTKGAALITPLNLVVSEAGDQATFTVRLSKAPTDVVFLDFTNSDPSEAMIDQMELRFDADNWDLAQTVTVTGLDDEELDGDVVFSLVTAKLRTTDREFSRSNPADLTITNRDNEVAPEPTTEPTPEPSAEPDPTDWPAEWAKYEEQVVTLVNLRRAEGADCGGTLYPPAPPVTMNAELRLAARLHSEDMALNNYFSHTSLDGRSPWDRIRDAGFTGSPTGENIAAGYRTPEAVMEGWMNSSGHCRNIMNSSSTLIGLGYYSGAGSYGVYWTMTLGR